MVDGVEAWKAPDAKAIADYLKAPAPGPTLALVGGELKKDAPLAKAVAAKGELLLWDVVMKAVARWIADQFKLHATKAEPEACRLLAELVGDDLYELSGEVDKLATWAGGDEVTAADVEALVAAARRVAAVEPHRRLGRARRRRRAARGRADARPHGRPASPGRSRGSSAA